MPDNQNVTDSSVTRDLKKEIRTRFITAIAAGLVLGVASMASFVFGLHKQISSIAGLVQPGTVVAFARKEGCPAGWVDYGPAYGRFILGANPDQRNNLQKREFEEDGGAETHPLTIDEMPEHNHGGSTSGGGAAMTWRGGPVAGRFGSGEHAFSQSPHNHAISSQGKGKDHNNMPPYIALYYCIKS